MPLARFKKKQKLLRRAEFTNTMDNGFKVVTPFVVLLGRPNQKEAARIGFIVSKKVGGAVVRNLVKRRLREIYRNLKPVPQGIDLVAIARVGSDLCDFEALRQAFAQGIDQLQLRIARKQAAAGAATAQPPPSRMLTPNSPITGKDKNGSSG